jgi:hypothetical protein
MLLIKLLPGAGTRPPAGVAENAQKWVSTNKDGLKVATHLDATQRTKIGQSAFVHVTVLRFRPLEPADALPDTF